MLRALTQILRHIEVSCDASSSVSDNGESSQSHSKFNTCRKNYVMFVTNLVKMQAGTLYQVPIMYTNIYLCQQYAFIMSKT